MPNERIKTAPPEKPREELLSDYFSLLAASEYEKYELINQTLYKITGGKFAHAQVSSNLLFLLGNCLWESEYIVAGSDAGVCSPETAFFAFPDGMVVQGAPETFGRRGIEFAQNPCLTLEALSESTKTRDRNVKREACQRIPSLQTYLLAEQEAPRVERYERAGDDWRHNVYEGLEAAFTVLGGAAELRLEDVYRGVNFGNQ